MEERDVAHRKTRVDHADRAIREDHVVARLAIDGHTDLLGEGGP
jgi:hypothetical protein